MRPIQATSFSITPRNWQIRATLQSAPDRAAATKISSRNQNVQSFYAACNAARNNNIIVFTISFDAGSGGETEMRNCASSAAH